MDENQQTTSEVGQHKGTNPLMVIGIIVVIIVIVGAFWMTNNQNKTTQNTEMTKTNETITSTVAPTEAMMANAIKVEGGEFYFKPNEIRVKKGEKVTVTLTNSGKMPHDFVLDEFNVKSETINSGSTTVEFIPNKTGTFEFYCSVGSHRQLGMKGNLIVE